MESGKKLKLPNSISVPVAGPDDPSWPPVSKEQVSGIREMILADVDNRANEYAKAFGRKTIRFNESIANDTLRSTGRMKKWNNYPPNEFEKIFVEQGLIPIGYYYNSFDLDTNELIFFSQDDYTRKWITNFRWKINKWFIRRGW